MNTYIGTKTVLATLMALGEYNKLRGWEPPEGEDQSAEGYLVEYTDGGKPNHPDHKGYISWSPRDVFERSYRSAGTARERAVIELADLDARLLKLKQFVGTPAHDELPPEQKHLLGTQLSAMQQYHDALDLRLARWEA